MSEPPPLELPDGALRFLYSNVVWDRHRRAVELAIERGWMAAERRDEALAIARSGPAAAILVEKGWITGEQRAEIEAQLERLDASRLDIARPAARIPEEAEKAMADPANGFGRYILIRRIGRGAMGAVWKAWDRGLNRWVAIKILHEESSPTVRERFLREARAAAKLRHPALVTVYDAGEHEGRHFLSMELINGGPLDARGPLKGVADTLRKVALALETAHKEGIVHRDLKPGNIMMDGAGEPHVVDFGLAHLGEGESSLTRTGSALGTPAYMAPEQVDNQPGRITARTDVYALGAILYEAATGRWPIRGENTAELLRNILTEDPMPPRRLNPALPRDLETILLKALDKDPARRYPGAAAFAADLQHFLNGEPIDAKPVSVMTRMVRRGIKHRAVILPVAGALAIAAGIGAWAFTSRQSEREALRLMESVRPVLAAATESLYQPGDDFSATARRVEEARRTLQRAVETAPGLAPGHYLLGQAQDFLGDDALAEAEWRKTVDLDPGFGPAYFQIARILLIRSFTAGLGSPDMVKAQQRLAAGYATEARGLLEKAVAHESGFDVRLQLDLAKAMLARLDKDAATIRKVCGEALARYGSARGAEDFHWLVGSITAPDQMENLGKALALRPKHPWALLLRGEVRGARGDADGQLEDFTAALQLRPRNAFIRALRANLLIAKGRFADAKAECTSALEIEPGAVYPLVFRSMARARLGDVPGALEDAEAAILAHPDVGIAWSRRGDLRQGAQQHEAALKDFTKAVELEPGNSDFLQRRGNSRGINGDLKGAIEDFDAALKANPRNAAAWLGRGTARQNLEDYSAALEDLGECLKLDPNNIYGLFNHGSVLAKLGRSEEARSDYEKVMSLTDPSHPVHIQVKQILESARKKDF